MNVRGPTKPVTDYIIFSGCFADFILAWTRSVQNASDSCRNGAVEDKLDRLSLLSSSVKLPFRVNIIGHRK